MTMQVMALLVGRSSAGKPEAELPPAVQAGNDRATMPTASNP
jgi:hypothetical protein